MEIIDKVAAKMSVVPKLKLGIRIVKPDGKSGGVKSTGSHTVKFLEEPKIIMGKSFEGKPRQEFKFIVEEKGERFRWMVPLTNKEGEPNYLIEKLLKLQVGDVLILEMKKSGANNYIDIHGENEESEVPDELPITDYDEDDEAVELAKALEKEGTETCSACEEGLPDGQSHNPGCKKYIPF
jgi:hypothetical protein